MRKLGYGCFLFVLIAVFTNCQAAKGTSGNGGGTPPSTPPQTATLTVTVSGPGSGTVTSQPKGINCPTSCKATFNQGTKVTLTSTAGGGSGLGSWSGACSGSASTCTITLNSNQTVTATFRNGDISLINHIVILLQENRSFDHYFGHLPDY
ncbi:MAG: InlB B-repeat-containing protein, partial [Acidobacteriota bacterium]